MDYIDQLDRKATRPNDSFWHNMLDDPAESLARIKEDTTRLEKKKTKRERAKPLRLRNSTIQKIQAEAEPKKPRKKREPKRRQLMQMDEHRLEVAIRDDGHRFQKTSLLVIETESLSHTAVAVYCYMESLMFDGVKDRTGNYTSLPEETRVISLSEIGERYALSDEKVSQAIGELRNHGFVYVNRRGANMAHSYTLSLRRKRIEYEIAEQERRSKDLPTKN